MGHGRNNLILVVIRITLRQGWGLGYMTVETYIAPPASGRRGYCYAELAIFFPNGGRNHRQYSLRLSTEGWPG